MPSHPGFARGTVLFYSLGLALSLSAAASHGQTVDHKGGAMIPGPGEEISGKHINVSSFEIPAGRRVVVRRWDGSRHGSVEIQAARINIAGTLDASGSGYGGAAGPGGGGGRDQAKKDGGSPGQGGSGGNGGNGTGRGANGLAAASDVSGGLGVAGAKGGGSYGGAGGSGGSSAGASGASGSPGGYRGSRSNGDQSTDTSVALGGGGGSGGSGAGGHSTGVNSGGGGGGGGAAGGNGGGAVSLIASESIRISGNILAKGVLGGNGGAGQDARAYRSATDDGAAGEGGAGGDVNAVQKGTGGKGGKGNCDAAGAAIRKCSGEGGAGGNGGGGAGGGILVSAPSVTMEPSATVSALGAQDALGNGGTVKVFAGCGGNLAEQRITGGRVFKQSSSSAPVFTTQPPLAQEVEEGSSVELCAAASGGGGDIGYQWRLNGQVIPGATGSCLALTSVGASSAGLYQVVATGACGASSSSFSSLKVRPRDRGTIAGLVWNDLNRNGKKDNWVSGDFPDLVFVIDASLSTTNRFQGTVGVGDYNQDGKPNQILDAELAGVGAMVTNLVRLGYGATVRAAVISFGGTATLIDLNPSKTATDYYPALNANQNRNLVLDIPESLGTKDAVRFFTSGTNYREALKKAVSTFQSLGTKPGNGILVFLSDGDPTVPASTSRDFLAYTNQVAELRRLGVNIRAFGMGEGAKLEHLRRLDPQAQIVRSGDDLVRLFGGFSVEILAEPALADATVYLDLNGNGVLDAGEPFKRTARDGPNADNLSLGSYLFMDLPRQVYQVRQVLPPGWRQSAPATPAWTVDLNANASVWGVHFGRFELAASPGLAGVSEAALSISRPASATVQGFAPTLSVMSRPGSVYQLQTSSDLVEWTTVAETTALEQHLEFQGTAPDGSSSRFYRVLVLPDEEKLR